MLSNAWVVEHPTEKFEDQSEMAVSSESCGIYDSINFQMPHLYFENSDNKQHMQPTRLSYLLEQPNKSNSTCLMLKMPLLVDPPSSV